MAAKFLKIETKRNDKITLSFTDVGKSGPHRDFSTWQICLLMLFAKIKFSRKFPNFTVYTDQTAPMCRLI